MRVLHVVKTSEGAAWAALQAAQLAHLGVEVHVAVPSAEGRAIHLWEDAGAKIHIADLDIPARRPWRLGPIFACVRRLAADVRPDVIHVHHFGPALILRWALGREHRTPRIFQVPGPLHLEHWPYRGLDLQSAGSGDFWIASSRSIHRHYRQARVDPQHLFLSYYGFQTGGFSTHRSNRLRRRFGIASESFIAGNISYMYAPKYYLGQRTGLKRHEDLIAALGLLVRQRADAVGILAGGPWGNAEGYWAKLRRRAESVGMGRILMPGPWSPAEVREFLPDFDCAIHVPMSENCGGVVEPLLAGVPVVAGEIGGLPEVVMEGITGALVPVADPKALAAAMLRVQNQPIASREMARRGGRLVAEMFDVARTAREVYQAYCHILDRRQPRPDEFDGRAYLEMGACQQLHA